MSRNQKNLLSLTKTLTKREEDDERTFNYLSKTLTKTDTIRETDDEHLTGYLLTKTETRKEQDE